MVSRQIELDEETDRILSDLAEEYGGDRGKVLADLVHARSWFEAFAEESEQANQASLKAQLERAERGFREGRFTTWEEVKRRNGL